MPRKAALKEKAPHSQLNQGRFDFELEEAVGFEPTVAINHDSFQDCSVRPLRHASVTSSLSEAAREENALETGKHLGDAVVLDRCGHGSCRRTNFFGALTHREG